MVFGPRGIGKTYFTLSLAVSLACGKPFLKWENTNTVGVLVVDGEMPLDQSRDRLKNLLPDKPAAPLLMLSHEHLYHLVERDLNLGEPDMQAALTTYLDANSEIRVIILDNISCLMRNVREDKKDDWSLQILPFLMWLRRRGIAVILVHHAGKGGDQRGTSAREDQLDSVLKLERLSDADNTVGAQFAVRFTKHRGTYGDAVSDFEASLIADRNGLPTWTWKTLDDSNEDRLLQLVEDGVDNITDAAIEMGITKGVVSKIKKKLQAKGLLAGGRSLVLAGAGK